MKHLVNAPFRALLKALPRMAMLGIAFVAAAAVWGMDAETTRAEDDGSGDYVPISWTRHVDGETGALQRIEFTITETNGDRYLGTYDGGEVSVRFYMAGSEEHAWSGAVPLKADGGEGAGMGLANAITLAVHGIEEGQRIYNAPQAALARPAAERAYEPRQAAPDEGGTGVNNFDREEWYEFSILLAPFLVLVTFILILMFMWDRHSGEEG